MSILTRIQALNKGYITGVNMKCLNYVTFYIYNVTFLWQHYFTFIAGLTLELGLV